MRSKNNAKHLVKKVAVSLLTVQLVLSTVVTVALPDSNTPSNGLEFLVDGVAAASETPNQIINSGFETGDLTGWNIVQGSAFGENSVSDETTWWAENIPYNQEGDYHLNGWRYSEASTGILHSSVFQLEGSGWISFMIGGAKNGNKVYVNVVEADSNQVIARYYNQGFNDVGFPDPSKGMKLANLTRYKADLSEHLGKKLYIEIVDNATSDWGLIFADAFEMYHEEEPVDAILANDIKPDYARYQLANYGFETGDLTGWTVIEGDAFGPDSVSSDTVWWGEEIPYFQEGQYHLNGWAYPESATGVLRSSSFELGGTGWISFKLGGGKNPELVYINVVDTASGEVLARYANLEFADIHFPHPDQGMNLANLVQYRADLSDHLGKQLYIEIVDNATSDWGLIFADEFQTFHELVPEKGIIATNIKPTEINNGGFEAGDLSGWTVDGDAFVVTDEDNDKKSGSYFAASSLEGIGSITSNVFTLRGDGTIFFTIVDNVNPAEAYVELYDGNQHTLLKTTQGTTAGEQIVWDVQQYYNTSVYLKVVDLSAAASIAVDEFLANNKGLISHFAFDEGSGKQTLEEVRGVSHDVNYVFNNARYMDSKDPRWTSDGVKGGALLFDGYSNYVEVNNNDIVPVNEALTIEAWVAPRSYEWGDGNKLSAIVAQSNQDRTEGFILGMYRHGAWSLQLGIGGQWIQAWVLDHPLEKYQWNYVAATFDKATGTIALFLNGEEVTTQSTPAGMDITPSSENLLIGKHNQPVELAGIFSYNMFSGLIDEVKLHNIALSPQEIQEAYDEVKDLHDGSIPEVTSEQIDEDPSVFDGDQHRPQYHAIPPQNWMNEAHAPIYYNGKYHLFYQHNPQGPFWHQIHWGHWVSDDMVHWENVRPALAPEAGDLDPDGIWSGSAAYDRDGNPVLFYTAGNDSLSPNQRTAIATPANLDDPYLTDWIKYPEPVTEQNGVGIHNEFRDPFVWYDEELDQWVQLVTSGLEDMSSGTALVYVSDDMYNWEYKGPLYVSDRSLYPELGTVWELPVLLPLGKDSSGEDKYIFLINPHEKPEHVPPSDDVQREVEVFYWIGNWDRDNYRFIPDEDAPSKLDVGAGYLTAESGLVTPDGRTVIFSMVQNVRTPQAEYEAGWAHNLALPVTVSLDEQDELVVAPIEELQGLRGDKLVDLSNKSMSEANEMIEDVQGDMLEIILDIEPNEAEKFGIKVRRSPTGQEETLIYYDKLDSTFNVDRTKSSIDPDVRVDGIQGGYVDIGEDSLKLHIYLDRSVVEAFANYKKKLTTRVYVGRYDSLGLQLWADDEITIKSMEVWEMNALTGEPAVPVYVPDNWDNSIYDNIRDLNNHDFATGDLTGWTAEGDAFQNIHVTAQPLFWDTIYFNPSQKIPGGYHLWGFNEAAGGDVLTGTLRSETFTLGGNGKINFLLSGGRDIERLYVALMRASDDTELFRETATNYEEYQRKIWDASQYIGEELYILVVDQSTGGFGHINVDDFNVPVKVKDDSTGPKPSPNPYTPPSENEVVNAWDQLEQLKFELKKNETSLQFPLQIKANDGKNQLLIQHPDLEVTVPAGVLHQLGQKLNADELGKAKLSFTMKPLSSEQEQSLASLIESKSFAQITVLGDIFTLELAVVKEDGTTIILEQFVDPITVKYNASSSDYDQNILGIYQVADNGELSYVRRDSDEALVATTSQFGTFAVLIYDRSFQDLGASHWAYTAITEMAAKGIINGTSAANFSPSQNVTRAEFVTMLYRALKLPEANGVIFNDVEQSAWYAKAVAAASEAGIIQGKINGAFAPNDSISRQEMAVIIYRALQYSSEQSLPTETTTDFIDFDQISSWAQKEVATLKKIALIEGRQQQLFVPQAELTRAEGAYIIYKLMYVISNP